MIIVRELNETYYNDLQDFCDTCNDAGYMNNDSFNVMKIDKMTEPHGKMWVAYYDNKIISISGSHRLDEVEKDMFRVLFRGATIPKYQKLLSGLSKTHMNSIPFSFILPESIKWCKSQKANKIIITTNIDHNASGHMGKTHKVMQLLAKQGIVNSYAECLALFKVDQAFWELNIDKYYEALSSFRKYSLHYHGI